VTRAEEIARNLTEVRARIAAAARAAGRSPESVRLLAVSKKMPADDVRAAIAAGQRAFGENYAQELRDKAALLAADSTLPGPPEWHFIGPLQSNKVKYVAGRVALMHSVDSPALLDAIEARGAPQPCLVQVNIAGEASKRGVPPGDLPALLDRFAAAAHVRCEGLMLIPPRGDARPHFAALRALRARESAVARPNVDLRELSMGMTEDLETAIAEGATIVRIGTAIFGARQNQVGQ
jgi:PLP dependent protein